MRTNFFAAAITAVCLDVLLLWTLGVAAGQMHPSAFRNRIIANAASTRTTKPVTGVRRKEGPCVMLDSGTTTTAIAQALRRFSQLTVITNAVNIAAELAGTNFEVILTGGTLRKSSFSLVGPLAEDVLEEMHADILFLGVDGFDVEQGMTTPNVLESRVNRGYGKSS